MKEGWKEHWVEAPDGRPVAFHDLPASAFPFTVRFYDAEGTELWSATADGPGAMRIPGFDQPKVHKTVVEFADGTVVVQENSD
jgi:hypothetical protein